MVSALLTAENYRQRKFIWRVAMQYEFRGRTLQDAVVKATGRPVLSKKDARINNCRQIKRDIDANNRRLESLADNISRLQSQLESAPGSDRILATQEALFLAVVSGYFGKLTSKIRNFIRRFDPKKAGKRIGHIAIWGGGAGAAISELKDILSSFKYENISRTNSLASQIADAINKLEREGYLVNELFEQALNDQCDFVGSPPI
tara:strand:+ start:1447 stop:2058 length:612 start_codon:yes stop_codon:yes gene_type:complete